LCSGIGFGKRATKINCDIQSEIFMATKPNHHSRMNHIDAQYHFLRDMEERKKVLVEKVETLENIKNSLTNFLSGVSSLGVERQWELLPWIYE
jgi:hypothetical protein